MTFRTNLAAASILFTITAASAVARQEPQAPQAPQAGAPSAQANEEELAVTGKKTTEDVCSQCHGLEDVTGRRRTAREWNDTVSEMVSRGAAGTDEQIATVKRYLMRYY